MAIAERLKVATFCLLGSLSICFLSKVIGQYGMEGALRFDSNWGASYGAPELHGNSGVFKYFGVPVWDGGQHLGIRLPTLSANYTLHPLVFLSEWVSTSQATLLFVLLEIAVLFYVITLTFISWDLKNWGLLSLFSTFAISGPIFIFLIHNDYSVMVGTFSGIFALITIFIDKALYTKKWLPTDLSRLTIKLIFVVSSLLTGHPRGFFIALPMALIILVKLFQLRRNLIRGYCLGIALMLMSPILLVQILEMKAKSSGRIRFGGGSLFDFFQPQRVTSPFTVLFYVSSAVSVSVFQPILWLLNFSPHITSRADFFAWPLLAGALLFSLIRNKFLPKPVISLRKSIFVAFIIYLLSSITIGVISKHQYFGLSWIIRADGWDYAIALLGIVVLSSPILVFASKLPSESLANLETWKKSPVIFALLAIGTVVSLLYPVAAVVLGPASVKTASYEPKNGSDVFTVIERANLRVGRRFVFLKSEAFEGRGGLSSMQRGWLPILGVPHPLFLSRNGYPTPANSSEYQDPLTLDSENKGMTDLPSSQCSPKLYDFLGIDTIILDFQDSVCTEKISKYFKNKILVNRFKPAVCYGLEACQIVTRIGTVNFSEESVSALHPSGFHSFYLSKGSSAAACPLNNASCLNNLEFDEHYQFNESPVKFCDEDCWMEYSYQIPTKEKLLIVPINYDPSIMITKIDTGQIITTENLQGLVGVNLSEHTRAGVLEIKIVPDSKMRFRVIATYLHALLLVYMFVLLCRMKTEASLRE